MGVVVYPRLAALLEQRHLTITDLVDRIHEQYGLTVDPTSLDQLTQTAPVQRADLQVAGATAAVLGVKLDDLFMVAALPANGTDDATWDVLEPAENRRLRELFDRKLDGVITYEEWAELDALVAKHGLLQHERSMAARARQRGVPVETIRQETESQLAKARAWWEAFETSPDRERILEEAAAEVRVRGSGE
jgi:hypothetical protein